MKNPFRYFDSSPEVIRLVVQVYVRYPLSLRNVEQLQHRAGQYPFEYRVALAHELLVLVFVTHSGTPSSGYPRAAMPSRPIGSGSV
jgi:hypothetical protein